MSSTLPGPVAPVEDTVPDHSVAAVDIASSASSSRDADVDQPKTPSKNAIKRAAKAARFAAHKLERRAREKESRKEKRRLLSEKRAAGELDDEDVAESNRHKKKHKVNPVVQFHGKVVVDLGFDHLMSDKEIVSLCSQLAYTYSANRKALYPFSLLYTSLSGRTLNRLEGMSDAGYRRWTYTEWWTEGYSRLWSAVPSPPLHPEWPGELSAEASGSTGTVPTDKSGLGPVPAVANSGIPTSTSDSTDHQSSNQRQSISVRDDDVKRTVIYLTADSDEELSELREDEIYIIGGIVDHNRYKNLCLNKAQEVGLRTARLPIGRYLASLPTRKVLTVNQVFEILLKWVETKSWEEALYSVVPRRKFQAGSKDGGQIKSEPEQQPYPEGEGEEQSPRPEQLGQERENHDRPREKLSDEGGDDIEVRNEAEAGDGSDVETKAVHKHHNNETAVISDADIVEG